MTVIIVVLVNTNQTGEPGDTESRSEPGREPAKEAPVETSPPLDPDILTALGIPNEDAPVYGEKIHQDLAHRWLPILKKGLNKEIKDNLIKDFLIPENCKLLRAPSLNPEIAAAVTDVSKGRDKKLEASQQQLGIGLTAVNKALSLLVSTDDKIQPIKILSDACRILCDLHSCETQARIKLLSPGLDKSFLSLIEDSVRDETLFGSSLPEKIKASKTIEKQGTLIKKADTKPSTSRYSSRPAASGTRYQGNWKGPSRSSNPRGGARGGPRKSVMTTGTRRGQPPQSYNNPRPWASKYPAQSQR